MLATSHRSCFIMRVQKRSRMERAFHKFSWRQPSVKQIIDTMMGKSDCVWVVEEDDYIKARNPTRWVQCGQTDLLLKMVLGNLDCFLAKVAVLHAGRTFFFHRVKSVVLLAADIAIGCVAESGPCLMNPFIYIYIYIYREICTYIYIYICI